MDEKVNGDKKASKTLPGNDRTRPFFQMHQPGKPQKNFPAKTKQFVIRTFYFLNYVSFASFVHENLSTLDATYKNESASK